MSITRTAQMTLAQQRELIATMSTAVPNDLNRDVAQHYIERKSMLRQVLEELLHADFTSWTAGEFQQLRRVLLPDDNLIQELRLLDWVVVPVRWPATPAELSQLGLKFRFPEFHKGDSWPDSWEALLLEQGVWLAWSPTDPLLAGTRERDYETQLASVGQCNSGIGRALGPRAEAVFPSVEEVCFLLWDHLREHGSLPGHFRWWVSRCRNRFSSERHLGVSLWGGSEVHISEWHDSGSERYAGVMRVLKIRP